MSLECMLSNGSLFQFDRLQKQLSQATDLFSVSIRKRGRRIPVHHLYKQPRRQA